MNHSRRFMLMAVAAVVLLAVGFSIGRFSAPGVPPTKPVAVTVATSRALTTQPGIFSSASANTSDHNPAGATDEWNAAWSRLSAQPHSPATDETAGKALQKLAESDPARALVIAWGERNRQRRTEWLHAVLRGWASVAPEAAAAWLTTLPADEREGAEGAVMDGASHNTAAAIALAQQLVQSDPADARSHAGHLLRVLSRTGEYEASVGFASRLPEPIRAEMLGTAFQYWAQAQPERALNVALKFSAGDTRKTALDAAISGWAQGDPSGLAEFSLAVSSVEDRTEVLQTAIREWVLVNPKAASEWIDRFDPKPEFDAGAAAVALQPDVIARQPEIAASWAESITDPVLRSSTLANVLREWSSRNATAALNYARNSVELQPTDRTALLNDLAAH